MAMPNCFGVLPELDKNQPRPTLGLTAILKEEASVMSIGNRLAWFFILPFVLVGLGISSTAHGTIIENYTAGSANFTLNFYGTGDAISYSQFPVSGTWTEEQVSDVKSCISTWASRIGNTPGRAINIGFVCCDMGSDLLGANSPLITSPNRSMLEYVWRDGGTEIRDIQNTWYEGNDAFIYLNSTANWTYGGSTATSGTYDFQNVVAHELGHSLGFHSSYKTMYGYSKFGTLTAWDTLLRDSSDRIAVTGSNNFTVNDGGVVFVGENAMAANGGEPVKIYSPSVFSNTSGSMCHLDEAAYSWALMSSSDSTDESSRPSELEWAMMEDMGWNVLPVPEPSTFIMLLILSSFGVIGWLRRNRQGL
jgi:hypothetical protein